MKRNEQIDGTEFACLTINADLEAENEKLKKQLALTEKALELCERHHIGFQEATHEAQVGWRETRIRENIAYFKKQAEKEIGNETTK